MMLEASIAPVDARDRALETARQLRAAAEETRRALETSRDLVRRSREQARLLTGPPPSALSPHADDPGPSQRLVQALIESYEAAQEDCDAETWALLSRALHHVGRRVASVVGPKAAEIALH